MEGRSLDHQGRDRIEETRRGCWATQGGVGLATVGSLARGRSSYQTPESMAAMG